MSILELTMDMGQEAITFYPHSQPDAVSTFLPILQPHLPFSNGLYNRFRAPHNLSSRHCLFAATFPPLSNHDVAQIYTILFADRSRHFESQIWIFNPLITKPSPLSSNEQRLLIAHLTTTIRFLKDSKIPEAPGWPFSPILRFACLHEYIVSALKSIAEPKEALPYITDWNLWNISTSTSTISSATKVRRSLPEGFTVSRVPEDQLDIVLSTSTIVRQPSTMLLLPSMGLMNKEGKLVAWAYIGIDGSLATLYVLPEYRGKGLATYVAVEMLDRYGKGEYQDLKFDGKSGWVHSDVKGGNEGSEGVMRSLGGKVGWVTSYLQIDSEKF